MNGKPCVRDQRRQKSFFSFFQFRLSVAYIRTLQHEKKKIYTTKDRTKCFKYKSENQRCALCTVQFIFFFFLFRSPFQIPNYVRLDFFFHSKFFPFFSSFRQKLVVLCSCQWHFVPTFQFKRIEREWKQMELGLHH